MNRRTAIKNTIIGLSALPLANCQMAKKAKKNTVMKTQQAYGVQLFTIPHLVDQNFRGTLELLQQIGYREIEFFGPYAFSAPATIQQWEDFKPMLGLKNNAFYGFSTKETAKMLKTIGLKAPSFHADIYTMRDNMTEMLDNLAEFDAKYAVIAALFEGRDNLDDYRKLAEEFNHFGEQMAKYNMAFVYHNHGYEHQEMDGEIPLRYLIENTHADNVKFELDIFWMSAAGADPLQFLQDYPERFKMMHLKDCNEPFRFAGDGGSPDQWQAAFPNMRDPGDGIFDIPTIVATAQKAGVQHFFLERDLAPEPKATLENSYAYLSQLGKG